MELRDVFELIICSAVPVLVSIVLAYYAKEHDLEYSKRFRVVAGLIFGFVAICGSEVGVVSVRDSVINMRDAAVICGGFFYGLPGGIIAGVIGGVERILAGFAWKSLGAFPAIACGVTSILAGFISGFFRDKLYGEKKPSFLFAGLFCLITEVVHPALVILFRINEYEKAFEVVKANFLPVTIVSIVAVLIALYAVRRISEPKKAKKRVPKEKKDGTDF